MYKKIFKRLFDLFICVLFVILFFWVFIILALLVKVKIGGPIIFKQIRPGKDGKLFKLYKFRSMTNEKDADGKLLSDDKRLTKFGKKLRESSLDELPEIFNIIKGDMALIGPRPMLVKDYVFFNEEVIKRQCVRPGLSGLAQVNGRNNISWEEKFVFDLRYLEKMSFCFDCSLIIKTFSKAFVKHDDISRVGFATDEDYGDYLLRTNKISKEFYIKNINKAKIMVDNYGKLQ